LSINALTVGVKAPSVPSIGKAPVRAIVPQCKLTLPQFWTQILWIWSRRVLQTICW